MAKNDELLASVEEKIAMMLAEAEAKANKIVAEAEAKVNPDKKTVDEATRKANARAEEYVEVELFYDGDKYKDDVFVCVNGETCLIKRGHKVKIKRKFAEVVKQSLSQDALTSQLINKEEAAHTRSAKEHGI